MTDNQTDAPKLTNGSTITCCPKTGTEAISRNCKQFFIPDGKALWWHCSVCHGWHVIIEEQQSPAANQGELDLGKLMRTIWEEDQETYHDT